MGIEIFFYGLYRLIRPFIQLIKGEGPLAFWEADIFLSILAWYKVFAGISIVLLFCGLIYVAYQMIILSMSIKEGESGTVRETQVKDSLSEEKQRWARVLEKLHSENEADWKVAILEADAIFEDIVGTMGLPGLSIGDKLKGVEPSDFLTLESAWEAHKSRNVIAHDKDGIPLSRREAQRIIALYEKVFREFDYL